MSVRRLSKLVLVFFSILGSSAFNGSICGNYGKYNMQPVSTTKAYDYVSKLEADAEGRKLPGFVSSELNEARDLCGCKEKRESMLVSFICDNNNSEPDYVIMYRKTACIPAVYTVEALIVNTDKEAQMSTSMVERVLRVFCRSNNGYLQTYPLKTWCGGRYATAIKLDKLVDFE